MSTAAKLKKRAIELEQKKQLDKALSLYVQFLQESDGSLDDADIPLYNRVGDLMLRAGNVSEALDHYEKAVDLYAERGFHNNAIALCNKVLRQSPGRASIYYKLGRISATKGFKSDAKKNFLEYADRMQKAGQIDEAFRALKEFADLCPDQDDIRLMLAEQLSKENRQDEALEQLQKLHDKLDSEGRTAEVRATVDRMKSIDPEAVPRTSGSYRPQKSSDLIFLDTSFEKSTRPKAPAPKPSTRQVSDPDLVMLTLGDQPDASVMPLPNAPERDPFLLNVAPPDNDATDDDAGSSDTDIAVLDVPATIEGAGDTQLDDVAQAPAPAASHVDADLPIEAFEPSPAEDIAAATPAAPPALALGAEPDPPPVDLSEPSPYISGTPLGIDYAAELASAELAQADVSGNDFFDFRSPPRSDDFGLDAEPTVGLDPDVAFPSLDLDDVSLPSADEVTSGASLRAALGIQEIHDTLGATDTVEISASAAALDGPADALDTNAIEFQPDAGALLEEAVGTVDDAPAGALGGLELDWPVSPDASATHAVHPPAPLDLDLVADDEASPRDDLVETAVSKDTDSPVESDAIELESAIAAVVAPTADVETSLVEEREDPWQARRSRAEELLEDGNRDAGIRELERMAAELEQTGHLEHSLTIVDELIRLVPDSIRHHQKRVELAFRATDRPKLTDAYIELGDALFRSGEERKARAVYQRVIELAPDDPRARAALDSVSSTSPAEGSGTIAALPTRPPVPPAQPPAEARSNGATHEPAPSASVVTRHAPASGGNGISASPASRKPSPLDRSAANADFVDLGDWLRASQAPKSTRMVTDEKPPTGDEQADFQEMLKRFKQGIADNVDEEDYESHYDLGVAYKEMGLMEEAVAEFQKALRGTANRVRTYEALGQCFVEKEQYQVASSVLARAMALGEGDDHHLVGVLYLMGRATEALNRPADALDYYQRVFAVDIEFRDVAERISAIERKAT